MNLARTIAPVLGLAALTSATFADVSIVSRFSRLRQGQGYVAPLPPSFSDDVSTTALGPVTLTTPHGATFNSSVTAQSITAQLHGHTTYGGSINPGSEGASTNLEVVFQVTGSPADISILILTGSSSVIDTNPGNPQRANTQIRLLDEATSTVLFTSDSNMTVHTGIPWWGDWNNALWTSTLAPGTYRIVGYASSTYTYSAGGGSGGGGSGSMNVQITLTPAPGAAAALALLAPIATRRRRT